VVTSASSSQRPAGASGSQPSPAHLGRDASAPRVAGGVRVTFPARANSVEHAATTSETWLPRARPRSGPTPMSDQPADWQVPSWEQIVREHSARVYRLAYRLTGNRHDAEDLTQETFVRVFRSLHTYTPGTFEGWLHRITTNLFLDTAR